MCMITNMKIYLSQNNFEHKNYLNQLKFYIYKRITHSYDSKRRCNIKSSVFQLSDKNPDFLFISIRPLWKFKSVILQNCINNQFLYIWKRKYEIKNTTKNQQTYVITISYLGLQTDLLRISPTCLPEIIKYVGISRLASSRLSGRISRPTVFNLFEPDLGDYQLNRRRRSWWILGRWISPYIDWHKGY